MSYASKRKYKLRLLGVHEDHEDDENAENGLVELRDRCTTRSFKAEEDE
ncbi:MAG: hypothetical protein ACKO3R_09550 [bacterium]